MRYNPVLLTRALERRKKLVFSRDSSRMPTFDSENDDDLFQFWKYKKRWGLVSPLTIVTMVEIDSNLEGIVS